MRGILQFRRESLNVLWFLLECSTTFHITQSHTWLLSVNMLNSLQFKLYDIFDYVSALIFSYLPLPTLLKLSPTCSTWNRLVQLVQKRRRYTKWLRVQIQTPDDLALYTAWFQELRYT